MSERCECLVCKSSAIAERWPNAHNTATYDCQTCGRYIADRRISSSLQLDNKRLAKISAVIREEWIKRKEPIVILSDDDSPGTLFTEMPTLRVTEAEQKFPEALDEKLDRALVNVSRLWPNLGDQISLNRSLVFATTDQEFEYLLGCLKRNKWILLGIITPQGWRRLAKIRSVESTVPSSSTIASPAPQIARTSNSQLVWYGDWLALRELGSGGQGKVFLSRRLPRLYFEQCLTRLKASNYLDDETALSELLEKFEKAEYGALKLLHDPKDAKTVRLNLIDFAENWSAYEIQVIPESSNSLTQISINDGS